MMAKEISETDVKIDGEAFQDFIISVVEDSFRNIIDDVISQVFSREKKLRTQSAAVQAENLASQANGSAVTATTTNPALSKQMSLAIVPPSGQCSTTTANWDNGKVTLKELNPFQSLKENFCPRCKLPRLLFPLTGIGAKIPDNVHQPYCTLQPFIQKPGHDIYGNPFPVDQTGKTKKEREAIRKMERQEKDNTPGSADTGENGEVGGDNSIRKLLAGGKGASYVPWHTCPQCKRSLLITKFAQHLEKCMGIGGRSARNTAAARLSGINGSVNGSQHGSRNGTPTPSSGKRDVDMSDEDTVPPKKKVKKDKKKEKVERKEDKPKVLLKLKNLSKPEKPSSLSSSSKPGDKNRDGSSKREREDTGEDTPKKKMKLSKEAVSEITA